MKAFLLLCPKTDILEEPFSIPWAARLLRGPSLPRDCRLLGIPYPLQTFQVQVSMQEALLLATRSWIAPQTLLSLAWPHFFIMQPTQ